MPYGADPTETPLDRQRFLPPSAPPGAGGGSLTQPRVTIYPEPRRSVVDFWQSKGVPEHVAEGIADRVKAESGFNPTVPGDGGTSVGLYQHHADRKDRLTSLPNWQDPNVQNEFAFHEVMGGDKQAAAGWEKIRAAKSRDEAARLWDQYFERSKDGVGGPRGYGKDPVIEAGNWKVSPRAVEYEQGRKDAHVVYMSPADYLAMTPESDGNAGQKAKRRSLEERMALGDEIDALPSLDVKAKAGKLEIFDQDGRGRAAAAQEAGVDLIPVSVRGAIGDAKEIVGMRGGEARPFDFTPVPKVTPEAIRAEPAATMTAGLDSYGAAQDVLGRVIGPQPARQPTPASREQVYQNEAGQPFTLSGAPVPQQAAPQPSERLPGEIPGVGRLSEMLSEIVRGAVAGGERARGVGEAGLDPTRPLAPEILSAATALGGAPLPPASRFIPGAAAPVNALRQVSPTGQALMADAAQARAMEFPRPSPISPERAGLAQEAMDRFNLPLTRSEVDPAQTLPAAAVRSLPGSGDAVRRIELQRRFNNEVSKTIGEDAPAVTQQVMKDAKQRIGDTLENIETSNKVKLDNQFLSDVSKTVRDSYLSMTEQEHAVLTRQLQNIYRHIDKDGILSGTTYGNLMKRGAALDKAANNSNPNIAYAAQELQEAMRDALQRSLSGADLAEYRLARYQWKNLKTIEPLVEKNPQGDISPALLNGRVSANFKNRAYDVSGTELDRLGKIGQAFLKEPRSSGTTERGSTLWTLGKGAAAAGALATGHFAGLPFLQEAVAAGTLLGGGRMITNYLARPGRAETLVQNALTRIPQAPGAKRNAISAIMSERGANTLTGP